MSIVDEIDVSDPPEYREPPDEPPADSGWKRDKNGKEFLNPPGRKGILYRDGEETPLEAIERDSRPKDQRPRRKSKTARKPPPPAKDELRELEQILAEALKSPAIVAAMAGDEWSANHFTMAGPALARNLVVASEHNPWLRRKLLAASSGGDMMMQLMTMVGVGGAMVMYIVPPVVYWFNLPVPDKGREMFGIPERREHEPPASAPPVAQAT